MTGACDDGLEKRLPQRQPWRKPVLVTADIKELTTAFTGSGTDFFMMMRLSDARLKSNLVPVGTSPKGIAVFEFNYVWGGPRYRGAIAQDVFKVLPGAVAVDACGYCRVDYAQIDVPFERISG